MLYFVLVGRQNLIKTLENVLNIAENTTVLKN